MAVLILQMLTDSSFPLLWFLSFQLQLLESYHSKTLLGCTRGRLHTFQLNSK